MRMYRGRGDYQSISGKDPAVLSPEAMSGHLTIQITACRCLMVNDVELMRT